jgi:maltooligosyltrehalose trehalohydrolase
MKPIGARYVGRGGCEFAAWAPLRKKMAVKIVSPEERLIEMEKDERGYWKSAVGDMRPGTAYYFRLDGDRDRPDPASHSQPEGVHGPSQVIDHSAFKWDDSGWLGIPLPEMIIYELHVGTFSPEGTFDAVIDRLEDLRGIGINAVELMPVGQFPGERNWGYDGACPFAVQDSYGGPEGLKRLVDECHRRNISVLLDVVYNHLGPEGNYLWELGPYFTDRYKTPWGWAINYDGAYSNEVRNYFISNALHWLENYHVDGLRIDAIHGISDMSARPFLLELSEKVEECSVRKGKKFYLIAESDLNDSRVIRSRAAGGFGFDAQWCDDFEHSVHTLLTGEREGYYQDFGRIEHIVKAVREGFVYSGQYSEYRKRSHGNSSKDLPGCRFISFTQNHDQVGNRMLGERLSALVPFESLKLAAGISLLCPTVPLLFMGEEYGEENPFLYFISHSDAALVEAVREGRKKEFERFLWKGEPPDPCDHETFIVSKIDWQKRETGRHKILLDLYGTLIGLRKEMPALASLDRDSCFVSGSESDKTVVMRRRQSGSEVLSFFNFGSGEVKFRLSPNDGQWKKILDSAEAVWDGPGSFIPGSLGGGAEIAVKGQSFAVFAVRENEGGGN